MQENNFYYETLVKMAGELTDESVSGRMSDCTRIIDQLTKNEVWLTVLKDSSEMVKRLDDNWQDFPPDSPQLREARVVKMAMKHILDLPMKYAQELDVLTEEMKRRQQPESVVAKDADND